ncbi:hypothetical protein SH449x_004404 [Pirellulaceae bacterium SH449]
MNLFERAVLFGIVALWWGGLTFYSAVVVPVGTDVLDSSELQGMVTQQVTRYLNALGVVMIAAFGWCLFRSRTWRKSLAFPALLLCTALLLALQVGLYWLHGEMVQQLAADADRDNFYQTHRLYLIAVAVQWTVGLLSMVLVLKIWRRIDHEKAVVSNSDYGGGSAVGIATSHKS